MIEVKKSFLDLSTVDHVHHVSDVHIRNYKRHDEYNRVFQDLYSKIRASSDRQGNHLICLTGDIVHSKTDVSPELVNEVQKFLTELSKLHPLLIIPGNHDANLNNAHRMDALTPIVNALNNPRIEYFKNSGVIEIGDILFYHWSVFDDFDKYPKPFDNTKTQICLFHGPVNNSTTETGFIVHSESLEERSFKGFDFTFLGDIHKFQYLNKEKTIAYPGSLIQQNYGEDLSHGYLLWDIKNRSSEWIKIHNDTAYYTVNVESGLYEAPPVDLPKSLYVRFRYKNTDQNVLRSIIDQVKKDFNVVEVSTQRVNTFTSRDRASINSRALDFRSEEQQNQLILKYLKNKYELHEEDSQKVLEINSQVNKSLKASEVPRNSMWIPKKFTFSNMFSYGEGNVIDFTDMNGTYGLFAANASGKSTLLDSLTYCIFDKCTKTNRGHQVMNSNTKNFYCKLHFELNGLDYFIERKAKRQSSGNVRVDVDFYYINEQEEKISLNGKDRTDTNNNIKNLLGNYEDFVLTTLSTQNNNTGFIDMNQKERKDLLSQFMDIGVFEELYNIANEIAKENSAVLRHYQKNDYVGMVSNYEETLKIDRVALENAIADKKDLEKKKNEVGDLILSLTKDIQKVDESIIDEESLKQIVKKAKSVLEECEKSKNDIQNDIVECNKKIENLKNSIDEIDLEDLSSRERDCEEIKKDISKLSTEIAILNSHISHKKEKLTKLNELEYDPNCKYCMNNIFVKDAINTKNEVLTDEDQKKKLDLKKIALDIKLVDCETVEAERQYYKGLEKDLSVYENKLISLNASLEQISTREIKAALAYKENTSKLELREKQLSAISSNNEIDLKIKQLKSDLVQIDKDYKIAEKQVTDGSVKVKILEKHILDAQEEIKKREDLEKFHKYYQMYLEAVHRDGIPHDIITATIPQIEEEVNNILSQLVDFKIIFETDDKNVNAYIAYAEDKFWPLELTSGMEKFVSSLAIRTALIGISTLPRPNFIAIDEGFGALDKSNLSSMSLLFDYLKTQFRFIMIISHIDSMKDIVDSHIEINKRSGRSHVMHK